MKKYTNIVFDLGNVLIDYAPHSIVSQFTQDINTIQRLVHEMFYKQEWLDLDQGIISEDEAYVSITKRLKQDDHIIVRDILDKWHNYLYEREDMINIVRALKLKGYKLFLFSNASKRFSDYKDKIKSLTYFDQMVISADIKHSKPSDEFYIEACKICHIELNESFFIDDSIQNIIRANHLGMDGYIHNGSLELLNDYLRKINILD